MCILGLAWGSASSSRWERWSFGRVSLQHHCPWCCCLRNSHWARFVTAGSSSQLLSCLAPVCAISAQTSLVRGEETMQAEAWPSHWAGFDRSGSWLIPDLVWLRPALARKRKTKFFFLSPVLCMLTKTMQCPSHFSNFVFVPFAMQAPKHAESISSHKCYGSSSMRFWHFPFSECQTMSTKRSWHICNLAVFLLPLPVAKGHFVRNPEDWAMKQIPLPLQTQWKIYV